MRVKKIYWAAMVLLLVFMLGIVFGYGMPVAFAKILPGGASVQTDAMALDMVFWSEAKREARDSADVEVLVDEDTVPDLYTKADVDILARLIYTEARGVKSRTEQAAVVWCVLNRLDNLERSENSIAEVVTAPFQFDYRPWVPVIDEFRELAVDVLERWQAEKQGQNEVGRVLPAEYQFFEGDGQRNHFTDEWKSDEFWDWSLPSPYED